MKVGSASKLMSSMPLDYVTRIMDAVSDGISLTIRLRNGGACLRPAHCGSSISRKRGRGNNSDDDNNMGGAPPAHRPNFSNAVDLGDLDDHGGDIMSSSGEDGDDDSFFLGRLVD